MPHAEVKYTAGLALDVQRLLTRIEEVLQASDPGSGDCKGRAYPAPASHHDHVLIDICMLPKAHRDDAWLSELRGALAAAVRPMLQAPCWLSIELRFSGRHYLTEQLT